MLEAVCLILSIIMTVVLMAITGIDSGWIPAAYFFGSVFFIIAILNLIGNHQNYKDKKKEAKDEEDEMNRKKEAANKYNSEVDHYNTVEYPALMETRNYTIDKAKELYSLYESIQRREIDKKALEKWEAEKIFIKGREDEYMPYREEHDTLRKEFSSMSGEDIADIYFILTSNRASTIKEAYDVIEMREHNKKMEEYAWAQAKAEQTKAKEAEQMRIDNARSLRQQEEQASRAIREAERAREKEKKDRQKRIDNWEKANRLANRPSNKNDSVIQAKRDRAWAELVGK